MSGAEWKKAPSFAEYAEAIGIDTKQILAVSPMAGKMIVFYTPDPAIEVVWSVQLRRDNDGILRPVEMPVEHPDMLVEIKKEIERRFREEGI